MKKIIVVTLFLLTLKIGAQEKDCKGCAKIDLVYDFECKTFRKAEDTAKIISPKKIKIKSNERFLIRVTNINRYLYDIEYKVNDIEYASNPSPLFISHFGELDTGGKSVAEAVDPPGIDAALARFQKDYQELVDLKTKILSNCKQDSLDYCCKDDGKYAKMLADFRKLKNFKSNNAAALQLLAQKKEALEKEAEILRKSRLESFDCDKVKCSDALRKEIAEAMKSDLGKMDALDAEIKKLESLGLKIDNAIDLSAITESDVQALIFFYKTLTRDKFEFTPEPIYSRGNKVNFDFTFSRHQPVQNANGEKVITDVTNLNFDVYVRRKWFVSFSTGPFFALSSNFRTDTYDFQQQPDQQNSITEESPYRLVKSGKEDTPYGLAAFGNVGTKVSPFFGLGLSIGAGATLSEHVKQGYFVGPSLFFGDEKQFNLTLGLAFIQVDKLKNGLYEYGTAAAPLYKSAPEVQYTKKFEKGFFLSVSYTIFSLNAKESGASGNSGDAADSGDDQ